MRCGSIPAQHAVGMGTAGTAFAVMLVRLQAETFSESSTFINTTTDGTGTVLRWTTSAPSTAMASVPYAPTASVEELRLYIRGASGGEDLAVFMQDGTAAANKIGVVSDVTNSYALRTLAVNIPAGQHTFYFAPNSNLSSTQRILLDYVEFHDRGGTTTPAQCADAADNDGDGLIDLNDPGCSLSTDNDETNPTTPPPPPPAARGQVWVLVRRLSATWWSRPARPTQPSPTLLIASRPTSVATTTSSACEAATTAITSP